MQDEDDKCISEIRSLEEDRLRTLEEQLHIYEDIVDNITSQDENPQLPPVIVSKEIALRHIHRTSFNSATKQIGEENTRLVQENEMLRNQLEDALYEKESILEEYEEIMKEKKECDLYTQAYKDIVKEALISNEKVQEVRDSLKDLSAKFDELKAEIETNPIEKHEGLYRFLYYVSGVIAGTAMYYFR